MLEVLCDRRGEMTPLERVWFAYWAAAGAHGVSWPDSERRGISPEAWRGAWCALWFGTLDKFDEMARRCIESGVFARKRGRVVATPVCVKLTVSAETLSEVRRYHRMKEVA